MQESPYSKKKRRLINLFPAYRLNGAKVLFISSDFHFTRIRLRLNWLNKNVMGTVFGGSIYAAVDPIYMLQLMQILGKEYVVWDKAATIQFIKPVKGTVRADFSIPSEVIEEIKTRLKKEDSIDINLFVELKSEEKLYAKVKKTLYIANKSYYVNRKKTKI